MGTNHFKCLLSMLLLFVGVNAYATVTWTRCTSVSDLTVGGTFIIGYEATANSGTIVPMQNTGTATTSTAGIMYSGIAKGQSGAGTINMSSLTDSSPYEVTIAASTTVNGAITIKCGDYYLGNTNTKNNLKLFTSEATTTSFTPEIGTNDVFTLKIAANATYTTLQYNSISGSQRFAVYGGTQKNVVIYKKAITSTVQASAPTLTTAYKFTTESYNITITNNESGATVYYTTDGTDPTTSSSSFTGDSKTITIDATTTVKAMAVIDNKDNSSVISTTYTKLSTYTTFADALAATSTTTEVAFIFSGQIVTAANTTNAYLQDVNGKSAIIYNKTAQGFTQGQTLTGTVICSIEKYYGILRFTNLTSSTDGISIGTDTPSATTKALTNLTTTDFGKLVTIEGLVYNGTTSKLENDEASIIPETTIYEPTYVNGETYTVTGIVTYYTSSNVTYYKIAARSADDVVKTADAPKTTPTVTAKYKTDLPDNVSDEFTVSNSGDATSYTAISSTPAVATIAINGSTITVTPVAAGTTTITITSDETDNNYNGTLSYNLTVYKSAEIPFEFNDGKTNLKDGMTQTGLGTDYQAAPKLKFEDTNDELIICFSPAKYLYYTIKGNSFNGGTFDVQESSDGTTYTSVKSYTTLIKSINEVCELNNSSHFIKFIYTKKTSGNVALGAIIITNDEPATLSIGNTKYATYYNSKYAYVMPTNLTGYIFNKSKDKKLIASYEEGSIVPAGEPLVINGEMGTYTLNYTMSTADAKSENSLKGTDEETLLESNTDYYFYGLSLDKNGTNIGFYWMKDEGAAFTNGAHKAYLKLAKTSDAKAGYAFNFDNTGINAVENSSTSKSIAYNITGQRVNASAKGIVIVNGKKYINK